MFFVCYKLNNLDVSNFDTALVQSMCRMFAYCDNLTTILGDGWTMQSISASVDCEVCGTVAGDYQMFISSTRLMGAISYNASKVDDTYANYTTGYFTYKSPEEKWLSIVKYNIKNQQHSRVFDVAVFFILKYFVYK